MVSPGQHMSYKLILEFICVITLGLLYTAAAWSQDSTWSRFAENISRLLI